MVGVHRLRAFTGRCSWAAGVLPRLRWAVRILYAVLADAERAAATGIEDARRRRRLDRRRG
eukprot:15508996-Heterocapsa_arctica.AAC.1